MNNANNVKPRLKFKWLGVQHYPTFSNNMQTQATKRISSESNDVVWFCEHEPVYTTGRRGINNSLATLKAPLIITERGGETTFHGTGQLMMYPILGLKPYGLNVRDYVNLLEQSCINLLENYDIKAERNCGFPGVWVGDEKIAAMGLRINQGVASHGMALNANTDLSWFDAINPCGTSRKMTSMQKLGCSDISLEDLASLWFKQLGLLLDKR